MSPSKSISRPFGRYMEEIAKLTDDERRRAAVRHSARVGGNTTVGLWPNRRAMAKTIRADEKRGPASAWTPLVPLADNEGC